MPTRIPISEEFREICRSLAGEQRTDDEWAAIESDDLVQTKNFVGGYDATERAFCFSLLSPEGGELWFQLTLHDVATIATGGVVELWGRVPD